MKKILFCVTYYYPHISGLTNYVKNIAEMLVKDNFVVTVLAAKHSNNLLGSEEINNVKTVRVPYLFKVSKGFFMPLFILYALGELRKTEQVVIFLPQFEGVLIAILAKIMRKKIHAVYVCEIVHIGSISSFIGLLLKSSHQIVLLLADDVISLTKDFAEHSSMHLRHKHKLKIIAPFVSAPVVNKNEILLLRKKIGTKKNLVGFVGRIAEEKGIEYLIETAPLLQKEFKNNFAIILAGPARTVGEEKYAQKINQLIIKYKNNIVRLGELPEEKLGAFYSLLDVLVLPSVSSTEAFGIVQVEAMLCGTPVVASDLPGVRVPIELTGMGEVIKVKNTRDLAEKIIKVIRSRKDYIKNKKELGEIFSADKILNQYKKLFS